jgi:aminoglycoside phosphotransferase family enzyme/predicted kinase
MTTPPTANGRANELQSEVVSFLSGLGGKATRRIDTHAASVFLTTDRAWKLKRAVRFGYLDFSTPRKRCAALEAELALNRRTAPGIYIAVRPVTRDRGGRLAIGGDGPPIDWVLEMHRFADGALLSEQADAGHVDAAILMRLAERIQSFHQNAEVLAGGDAAPSFRKVVEDNAESMAAFPEILDGGAVRLLAAAQLKLCQTLTPLIAAREDEGRFRHGHGDLHLENIALIDGEPTPFDCLEFSDELARVDVLYDLSFLLMDLWHRGMRYGANIVLNHYLDHSALDERGIALLPLFLSVRASIRAHVLAAQSSRCGRNREVDAKAREYLILAQTVLTHIPPRLVAIGGLSGSGKSTVARHIGHLLGCPPGARILRSDVIRKRMAGVTPKTRLSPQDYSAAKGREVYHMLNEMAADTISQGSAVIVDAVFADETERSAIGKVALAAKIPFDGIWLAADEMERTGRIQSRAPDASDADAMVARAQSTYNIGNLSGWQQIMAAGPIEEAVATTETALGL